MLAELLLIHEGFFDLPIIRTFPFEKEPFMKSGSSGVRVLRPNPQLCQLIVSSLASYSSFPGRSVAKNPSMIKETQVQLVGREDPLEKGMATHSRTLAQEFPWTEEPDGLESMGSQRARHDWEPKQQQPQQPQTTFSTFCLYKIETFLVFVWPWENCFAFLGLTFLS